MPLHFTCSTARLRVSLVNHILNASAVILWFESTWQDRPYFCSSFGKKRIEGKQVEEGEGRGPLKEFFELASAELGCSWAAEEPRSGKISLRSGTVRLN